MRHALCRNASGLSDLIGSDDGEDLVVVVLNEPPLDGVRPKGEQRILARESNAALERLF
jgi:hypothetical protein